MFFCFQVISLAGQRIALSMRDVNQKNGKDLTPMTDQVGYCVQDCSSHLTVDLTAFNIGAAFAFIFQLTVKRAPSG